MNVVDSSGWLEYFADGKNAEFFAPPIENLKDLVVPVITIYEVFKKVHRDRGEDDALQAAALMQQGNVADITVPISLLAAKLSLTNKLPMADSLILAAAKSTKSTLWTQDEDFQGMPGVKFISRSH